MEKLASAEELIGLRKPERPVIGLRPHAAGRAARWFLDRFDGDVAYAYKANSSVFLLGALYGAGIRHFDVASIPELEDAATIPDTEMHFMHPVKSRRAIRRAYDLGVRSFALDGEDELERILDATRTKDGPARDLKLFIRVTVPAKNSLIPLEHKFGIGGDAAADLLVKTRQLASEVGLTFHVGSQTTTPESFQMAITTLHDLIVKAGVVIDVINVGGGFPARYPNSEPEPLPNFINVIDDAIEELPVREDLHLMCEPGRALVAEAESLIVRVDARRDQNLFINDGSYGILFDAAHLGFVFPARLITPDVDRKNDNLEDFELWGPTCDSIDHMPGPFRLPKSVREGDYIELGNIGAYGRAIAGHFNGYGKYDEVILLDEPMMSMYANDVETGERTAHGRH